MHAVRVDEVAAVLVGNLHRDMVEDHLVPAHHREDAIAGGEFLPRRPFGFAVLAVALELGRHGLFLFGGRFCPATYATRRSEEHTSELQSLMRISYAVFCLKKKNKKIQ